MLDEVIDKELERELISKAEQGDYAAFEELVKVYGSKCKRRINGKFGGLVGRAVAEDIYQECLIEIFKSIGECDVDKGGFFSFMMKNANYKVKRYFEKINKEKIVIQSIKEFKKCNYDKDIQTSDYEKKFMEQYEKHISYKIKQLFKVHKGMKTVDNSVEDEYISKVYEKNIFDNCFELLPSLKNPHKFMLFLLNKVVYSSKNNNKSGSPKEIMENFSDKKLYDILLVIKKEYRRISSLPDNVIEERFDILSKCLDEMEDGIKIGDKLLKEYFSKNPTANISDWSYRVKESIMKKLGENYLNKIYDN